MDLKTDGLTKLVAVPKKPNQETTGPFNKNALLLLNLVTIAGHAAMMIWSFVEYSRHMDYTIALKVDRARLIPRVQDSDIHDFVQLVSPWTGSSDDASGQTLSESCGAAGGTSIRFMGNDEVVAELWPYPKKTGYSVHPGLMTAFFFLFSFVAQTYHLSKSNKEGDVMSYYNAARFVEYSFSGSLVFFTVAISCGVTDMELLLCLYVLTWACMICGSAAEICLRLAVRVGRQKKEQAAVWEWLRLAFWISHTVGVVCMVVPWIVIGMHFYAWFDPCTAESLRVPQHVIGKLVGSSDFGHGIVDSSNFGKGAAWKVVEELESLLQNNGPRSWIQGVFYAEAVLFCCFWGVQLSQGVLIFIMDKGAIDENLSEMAYIILSAGAKISLGVIILLNIY